MMKRLLQHKVSVITMTLILIIWQISGILGWLPKYILPTPVEIVIAFFRDYQLLMQHTITTVSVSILGLIVGIVSALMLSILMDTFLIFHQAIYPLLVIWQTIPTLALAPIMTLWLGYGVLPKIVLIALTTLFPIVINVIDGFNQTDKDFLQLFQSLHANSLQVYWHLKLPLMLPYFFSGLRVSASYAIITCIISEWLGGFNGLGVYMIQSRKLFQYDTMFAIIIIISSLSLFALTSVKWLEKRIIKWGE